VEPTSTPKASVGTVVAPGFRRLWISLAFSGVGLSASQLGLSWVVLVATDSPLAVGVLFAARMLPSLLFGIPVGALTDRFDRRLVLIRVNAVAAVAGVVIAAAVALGWPTLAVALAAGLVFGLFDTFRVTASQAYIVDLVGIDGARRGVAVANIAPQSVAAIGAFVGGAFLERYGSPLTFLLAGAAWLASALVLIGGVSRARTAIERANPDLRSAMALVLGNHDVRALMLLIALTEILGFSGWVVVPTMARDVLGVGAGGFGVLLAARAIGGVALLIWLARGRPGRSPTLFIGAMAAFGIGQIAFGINTSPLVAVVLCLALGGAAACCDALGQTLLQQVVPDASRGAAMGVWFFSLGFGPIGFVGIGALAEVVGAPLALVTTGVALLAVSGLAVALSPVRGLGRPADVPGES
jgi:MFS family permease